MSKKGRDNKITGELIPLTDRQLLTAAIDVLKDAEVKLGALGDYLHELRRQTMKLREKLEVSHNSIH